MVWSLYLCLRQRPYALRPERTSARAFLGECALIFVVFLYYNINFFESQVKASICLWTGPDRGLFGSNMERGICRSCDEKNRIWCFGAKFGPAGAPAGRPKPPGRRRGSPQFPLQNLADNFIHKEGCVSLPLDDFNPHPFLRVSFHRRMV